MGRFADLPDNLKEMKRIFLNDWKKYEGKFDKTDYRAKLREARDNAWMSLIALLIVFALYLALIFNM